jgi:hypothetical protein
MTLFLFISVNPARVATVVEYMHYVLLKLSDFGPVGQSQEYNVTMAHSATQFLKNELDKWEKQQAAPPEAAEAPPPASDNP